MFIVTPPPPGSQPIGYGFRPGCIEREVIGSCFEPISQVAPYVEFRIAYEPV